MKVLIVDDEALARERLFRLLHRILPDAEVAEASTGMQAIALASEDPPELVLLDIRMPAMDGIEVAGHLQEMDQSPAVVFCTAYDNYAMAALEQQAVAYLLKPVREEELRLAIERAGRVNRMQLASLNASDRARTHISSETHRGLELVPVSEVRCFIAEQKYVSVCHPDGKLLIPDSLKELEQEFGDAVIRVHRNALVALAHVKGLRRDEEEGWLVELDGVDLAPAVSRRHLSGVKDRLRQR
jgi:two-component system response regulator AlgR